MGNAARLFVVVLTLSARDIRELDQPVEISPCHQPLQCETEPSQEPISCEEVVCTQVQCPSGRTCARCFQASVYRAPYQGGVRWSDGVRFFTCRDDGEVIASGMVDERGEVSCVDECVDGHCHGIDGPYPFCD